MSTGILAPPTVALPAAARAAERSRIWRKLVRNPAAFAGVLILIVVIGAAVFAPRVAPHDPEIGRAHV